MRILYTTVLYLHLYITEQPYLVLSTTPDSQTGLTWLTCSTLTNQDKIKAIPSSPFPLSFCTGKKAWPSLSLCHPIFRYYSATPIHLSYPLVHLLKKKKKKPCSLSPSIISPRLPFLPLLKQDSPPLLFPCSPFIFSFYYSGSPNNGSFQLAQVLERWWYCC